MAICSAVHGQLKTIRGQPGGHACLTKGQSRFHPSVYSRQSTARINLSFRRCVVGIRLRPSSTGHRVCKAAHAQGIAMFAPRRDTAGVQGAHIAQCHPAASTCAHVYTFHILHDEHCIHHRHSCGGAGPGPTPQGCRYLSTRTWVSVAIVSGQCLAHVHRCAGGCQIRGTLPRDGSGAGSAAAHEKLHQSTADQATMHMLRLIGRDVHVQLQPLQGFATDTVACRLARATSSWCCAMISLLMIAQTFSSWPQMASALQTSLQSHSAQPC
jgi:hypothetical protein